VVKAVRDSRQSEYINTAGSIVRSKIKETKDATSNISKWNRAMERLCITAQPGLRSSGRFVIVRRGQHEIG